MTRSLRYSDNAIADDLAPLSADELSPCAGCATPLKRSSAPTFHRFAVKLCGLDNRAAVLGGDFAGLDPARIMASFRPVNVCQGCLDRGLTLVGLLERLDRERAA